MTLQVTERKNPNALLELQWLIDGTLLAMAEVGADDLRENLSPGPRSGVHYPGQSLPSSAPGEFSQGQIGTVNRRRLRSMVKAGLSGPGRVYFGLVPQNEAERKQAEGQEFGNPGNNLIGRANVRKTAYAPRTQARMKAVRRPR